MYASVDRDLRFKHYIELSQWNAGGGEGGAIDGNEGARLEAKEGALDTKDSQE